MQFLPNISPLPVVRFENSETKVGKFSRQDEHLSTHSAMSFLKMHFLPNISPLLSSWIWNFWRLKGIIFWEEHFEYQQPYVIFKM